MHAHMSVHIQDVAESLPSPPNNSPLPCSTHAYARRRDLEHPRDPAGALRDGAAPRGARKGGSSRLPSATARAEGCGAMRVGRSCPAQPRARLARKVRQLPPPGARGIRLERSNKVPSPRGSRQLQAETAPGETGAGKVYCFSRSYFFLAVFKKMRGNDMGNVRNKARSN